MLEGQYIGVVIPARNEEHHIQSVLETLPEFIDIAVVIDDGSSDATYQLAESTQTLFEKRILRTDGIGVGGAIDLGHQHLLENLRLRHVVQVDNLKDRVQILVCESS